ncbi:MAG TPA: hypothetical protein VFQ57_05020 [Sphingomonas sp.]|jgi:hypothetical protein|nr:hypothetical protein [Sphingomonas sp.]
MVTMSNVWDRTTDVLRGRGGILASIAVATLFLPAIVSNAVTLFLMPGSTTFVMVGAVVTIVVLLLSMWGQLVLVAVASDPETTRTQAAARATARFPALIAVSIIAFLVLLLLFVPIGAAIGMSGIDFAAVTRTGAMPNIGRGTITFLSLYGLMILIAGLFVGVRMVLLNAVVLNERLALGAFRRSWSLTRGLTWRLVGVVVLYVIVVGVAASAAQFVSGAIVGLIADSATTTAFLASVVAAVVTTIFSVVAAVFTAQLYVAVTQRGIATVFA